jgi:hypothetical protein
MLLEWKPEYQSIFFGIPVIRCPLAHRPKAGAQIERLGRLIRFSHLQKNLLHSPLPQSGQSRSEKGPGDPQPATIRRYREVQDLAGASHLPADQVSGNAPRVLGHQPESPG